MDNPFGPPGKRRSDSPPTKNTFQRELDAKMRDRRKKGLSADITPLASERGSDDELASDDELMGGFEMTSKGQKSWQPPSRRGGSPGYDRESPSYRSKSPAPNRGMSPFGRHTPGSPMDEDDEEGEDSLDGPSNLMMTMKKPLQPGSFMKKDKAKASPSPRPRHTSRALDTLNEMTGNEPQPSPRGKKTYEGQAKNKTPWEPPNFQKAPLREENKENTTRNRPKSPSIHGRKSPGMMLDSLEESPRALPSPRLKKTDARADDFPKPKPRFHKDRMSPHDDQDELMRSRSRGSSRGSSPGLFEHEQRAGTRTPEGGRKTPTGRTTPHSDRKSPANEWGRKTTTGRKTSPDGKSTETGRRTPVTGSAGRNAPQKGRGTPTGRKTPNEGNKDGRKSPLDGRSTPGSEDGGDKRRSVLDMFAADSVQPKPKQRKTKSKLLISDDSDDSDGGRPSYNAKVGQKKDSNTFPSRQMTSAMKGGKGLHDERNERRSPVRFADERSQSLHDRRSPMDSRETSMNAHRPSLRKSPGMQDEDMVDGFPSAFRPTPQHRKNMDEVYTEREGRSRSRTPKDKEDRDSSLCRDVEADPTMKRLDTKEGEELRKKQPRAQTKEKQLLDQVIDSVNEAQDEGRTMKYIDSHAEKEAQAKTEKESTSRPTSGVKYKPKPRYAKPEVESPSSSRTLNFDSTTDIRNAVFQDWYAQRMETAKKELKEKKKKEKEEEEKKKKAEKDKVFESKASYDAWKEGKKDFGQDKIKKQREDEEKERKELHKKEEQKKDAAKLFTSWKEEKDAILREQIRKKKRQEELEEEKKKDKEKEKKKDARTAFNSWDTRKQHDIKKNQMEKTQQAKRKEQEEKREQRQRDEEAKRSYNSWMENKESQQTRSLSRQTSNLEDSRPAFRPAGKTIPMGR